jgi:hypothetical protein
MPASLLIEGIARSTFNQQHSRFYGTGNRLTFG